MLKFLAVRYVDGIPIKFYQDTEDKKIWADGEDLRKAFEASPGEWTLAHELANLKAGTHYRKIEPFGVVNPN